jgi:uncharacterized protein YndB with AHSA1/START domain
MNGDTVAVVRVRRRLAAAPERVFAAWTDPAMVAIWMPAPEEGEMVRAELDLRVGGRFRFVVRRQGEEIAHEGEYLEIDPPRRLVFTWTVPRYGAGMSRVAIDIVASDRETALILSHEPVTADLVTQTRRGWIAIVDAIGAGLSRT